MQRISVVGNSASGKSMAARRLAEILGLEHLELDSVMHQPNWTPLEDEVFRATVTDFMDAHPSWVIDGNYPAVQPLIWERADTVVWVDPPKGANMRAIVGRTLRRVLMRETLWNGNRESWKNLFCFYSASDSMIGWAWHNHATYRQRYGQDMQDPRWAELEFLRFGSWADLDGWLVTLADR